MKQTARVRYWVSPFFYAISYSSSTFAADCGFRASMLYVLLFIAAIHPRRIPRSHAVPDSVAAEWCSAGGRLLGPIGV